ncbi:hypothetical protein [Caldisalinibacter kiritimatiensis]|uniref:Clostridial MutS2-related protein n=1 Tax=Caldisalinibacter kiritimatiensis TaxID=1304284 RepID=R1CE21_9FIRM|nr:hypothetical protein [Caldisalinibacter kiritimatiensis]EOD00515.1 Clostridial MutS2-related protein [Caldisalinibacter kiritimatiensis]
MNSNTLKTLEYNKIKEKIKEFTVSDLGKKLVDKMEPKTDIRVVERMLRETSEAKAILNTSSNLPFYGIQDIEEYVNRVDKGIVLQPNELMKISDFLRGCRKIKRFMQK